MLNLHCNNNDKKKKLNKNNNKNMRLPRFEPRICGFKVHIGFHYPMEANGIK